MRVVVVPHDLAIGGSQLNAIDLAGAVRDLGHDVIVHGIPGPVVDHVRRLGLDFVAATDQSYRPAPQRSVGLARLVADQGIDLVHAYEWPPCLDAYFGPHLRWGTPLVCTVLSMHVPSLIPRSVPLMMGTEALAEIARRRGIRHVSVLEPPVDTCRDVTRFDGGPSGFDVRAAWGIGPHERLVVTVSRLSIDLKLDALERLIDAVDVLAMTRWLRLLVVGGGEAEVVLRRRAEAVNERIGRIVVSLTGEQADPRPFYEAADIVAGMGSSALRAMSFGRPVVVQGEAGFAEVFEPSTSQWFLRHGFWGIGDGCVGGAAGGDGHLRELLAGLLDDDDRRARLGAFGRETVVDRFDLQAAALRLVEEYRAVTERSGSVRPSIGELTAVAVRAARHELGLHGPRHRRRVIERRNRCQIDPANIDPANIDPANIDRIGVPT